MHAHQRGSRGSQVREDPHEALHRRHQPGLVGHEGDERPEGRDTLDDPVAAVQEDDTHAGREQQSGQPSRQVSEETHREKRPHERIIAPTESVYLA